jgi:hypothetical protein
MTYRSHPVHHEREHGAALLQPSASDLNCMSMLAAGGGLARGRVVGSTDARGGDVKEARVTPADLGATDFRHLGIDLGAQWTDGQGRPQSIIPGGGRPIPELS